MIKTIKNYVLTKLFAEWVKEEKMFRNSYW